MKMTGIYEKRLCVYVFCPSGEATLAWTDLIVYSYLAYQDRYGKQPTTNRLAYLTGLSNGAVDEARARLSACSLVVDGKPVPKDAWFWTKESKGAHWSTRYAYWRCLVRAEESPLTATDTMVFSYLMDKKLSGFVPQRGWSYEYVATALCMTPKTVASCLDRLASVEPRLFQRKGNQWGLPSCLVGPQTLWFKTREKPTRAKPFFEFDPSEPAPEPVVKAERNDATKKAVKLLGDYIADHVGRDVKTVNKLLGSVWPLVIMEDKLLDNWKEIVDREVLSDDTRTMVGSAVETSAPSA